MELTRLEIEYNKIKNLKQYKKYSEQQLREEAYKRAIEYQVDIDSLFKDKDDIESADKLLKKYLDDYIPETISDINTLRSILFLEILNGRLQDTLNQSKEDKENTDLKTVETIHKNLNQILILKNTLGLTKDKKDSTAKSVDQKINLVRKQFRIWCEMNQASRSFSCPYCRQLFLLKIRNDYWDAQKHPFFKDRVLGNKKIVQLYFQNKLTKKDVAEILETSEDYIDWLADRWKLSPEYTQKEESK